MDQPVITHSEAVFSTPWFDLLAKHFGGQNAPHYSIRTGDYVSVFAVTAEGAFPLVRQYRPAVETSTLELPCGHVEEGDTPEEAARKELLEETGYVAEQMILLANLAPDTGRLGNRMWCFFAPHAMQESSSAFQPEEGVEPLIYRKGLRDLLLTEPAFCSALNRATILMAIAAGHIEL